MKMMGDFENLSLLKTCIKYESRILFPQVENKSTVVEVKYTITPFLEIKDLASFIITNATFHYEILKT